MNIYTSNKQKYELLQDFWIRQSGGGQDNIFLNKEYFWMHHRLEHRKRRLRDFSFIISRLKNRLVPKGNLKIDDNLLEKYINLHKKENRHLIREIMKNLQFVSFKDFLKFLNEQINRFNDYIKNKKKYIFVLGVGNDVGFSSIDFNLFKSNLWVFLLAWKYLKIKPYDIVLSLNTAIRLYYSKCDDFVLMDDCSYSGSQLVESVLKSASSELLYHCNDCFVINEKDSVTYKPVLNKKCNIHIIVPFISTIAMNKINDFQITSSMNVIMYVSKIVKSYGNILDEQTINKIRDLYKKFYTYINFAELIPIFFQHKIADMVSTIDLILIKGQVLDNPNKKLVFIKECQYNKNKLERKDFDPKQENFIYKKLYCPIPPYLKFNDYLKKIEKN